MRISLAQQFVIATVTLTLAVLVATLLLARWSFERGFAEYVVELERKRLGEVGAALLARYDPDEGWATLSQQGFNRALRAVPDFEGRRAPPPRRERPPLRDRDNSREGVERRPPPDGDVRDRRPPLRDRESAIPTALFDTRGELLVAYRFDDRDTASETLRYPLEWQGTVVGELRSSPRRRLESPQETAFAGQQRRASLIIFAVAVVLAIAMAVLLSRRLLAPLRRAHGALGVIAGGDYSQRLESRRGDELGELMRDIDVLSRTLEDNQGARKRWIADISHELRTPVSVLKGELEAIADGIRPFDEFQLASLQAEVTRLAKLIEDLYQLSLADLGGLRYEFDDLDLSVLVADMGDEYRRRYAADDLDLQLSVCDSCHIRGDRQRLEQLLRNLLENSRAYTNAPGVVQIHLECEGGVVLRVEDSAPGVPAELCETLFDPLYRREESRSRRSAGAGLGLAIARAVVDAHGGEIQANPSSLGGLAVRVTLPDSERD